MDAAIIAGAFGIGGAIGGAIVGAWVSHLIWRRQHQAEVAARLREARTRIWFESFLVPTVQEQRHALRRLAEVLNVPGGYLSTDKVYEVCVEAHDALVLDLPEEYVKRVMSWADACMRPEAAQQGCESSEAKKNREAIVEDIRRYLRTEWARTMDVFLRTWPTDDMPPGWDLIDGESEDDDASDSDVTTGPSGT